MCVCVCVGVGGCVWVGGWLGEWMYTLNMYMYVVNY